MNRLALLPLVFFVGCGDADTTSRAAQLASPLCNATVAKSAFGSNAVCTCENLALVGEGFLARSTTAAPANVGVNGSTDVVGLYEIGGSLISMKGVGGVGNLKTGGSLSAAADVAGVGRVDVGGDMMVGGRVANVGELNVKGTLGASGDMVAVGTANIGARGAYVAPAEPCDCGALAVDVAAKVADAKTNGAKLASTTTVGDSTVKLTSGTYYADSLASVGTLNIQIDGAVEIAIGGSLQSVGLQHISLTQGSTLDLYVAESFATVGDSLFGEGADPGSVRVFVGSSSASVGTQTFKASLYMPEADLALVGDTAIEGAVFARSIGGVGRLTVDYAAPVAAAPDVCVVPGGPAGAPRSGSRGGGAGGIPAAPGSQPEPQ